MSDYSGRVKIFYFEGRKIYRILNARPSLMTPVPNHFEWNMSSE